MSEDLFDGPQTEFVTPDDLVGRAVVFFVKDVEVRPSTAAGAKPGDTYTRVTADCVVLDGEVTDKVTEVPMTVTDMYVSGSGIAPRLKGGKASGKPIAGRIDSKPSKFNAKLSVAGFQPFAAGDPAIPAANDAVRAYRSQNPSELFD